MKTYESKEYKLIIQLIFTIILSVIAAPYLPLHVQKGFLTVSMLIKELLMQVLPFIVFSAVYLAICNIPKAALKIVLILISFICLSNLIVVLVSGSFGYMLVDFNSVHEVVRLTNLEPLVNIRIPRYIKNEYALALGFILGLITNYYKLQNVKNYGIKIYNFSMCFISKLFIPLLPLFVFGFLIKLISDGIIYSILNKNIVVIISMFGLLVTYVIAMYLIATSFNRKKFKEALCNVIPPAVAAFSSMSSAAVLPLSIEAAKKNTGNDMIAKLVMPTSVNIHMIGDGISIPILALTIMHSFGHPLPSIGTYLLFSIWYVIAKFSGAGVPGGTVLIMIPILEKYLGFNSEMIGIITTFYILVDPFTTTVNVLGNNAFVIYISNFLNKFKLNSN